MKKGLTLFTTLVLFTLLAATTFAQNFPTDLGSASGFNVFVLTNANLSSADVEGKVAVGDNGVFTGYTIGDKLSNSNGTVDVLVVGDSLIYNGGVVYNGNVVYGNYEQTNNLDITNGDLNQGTPIDFVAAALEMGDISRQWQALVATGNTEVKQNGEIEFTGLDPDINVFHVEGADLSNANNVVVDVPTGATALINVSDTLVTWSGGNNIDGNNQTKVVYNFYEAAHLTLSTIEVKGSILAPYAALNFPSGLVVGTVIAYSMQGAGQVNNALFTGEVPYIPANISSDCEVTISKTLTGKTFNVSPKWFNRGSVWAGTFFGYVNNHSTEFYCIDFQHNLDKNKPYEFDEVISGPIAYILHSYYPNVPHTGTNGQLSNRNDEAAAVQAAIWSYSDGVDLDNITNSSIRDRAKAIAADALGKTASGAATFEILPMSQVKLKNSTATFAIYARDENGDPVQGAEVTISATSGTLSATTGTTDANGKFEFTVTDDGSAAKTDITITTFDAVIPVAARYFRPGKQTLVTNKPVITCLTTMASVTWTNNPVPGNELVFDVFTTTNSNLPTDNFSDVAYYNGILYGATYNNGLIIFDPETLGYEQITTADGLPSNSLNDVYVLTESGYEGDVVAGMITGGFAYYDQSADAVTVYNTQNSDFTGSTVNEVTSYTEGGVTYLLIAHDTGVSIFNLDTQTFTNFNNTNSDIPPGVVNAVTVDNGNWLWVGTNFGLAKSEDFGATWVVYLADETDLPSDQVSALANKGNTIYVGTSNAGLAALNRNNNTWTNYSPFIAAQPVTSLLYEQNKLFVGNYDHGLNVFENGDFAQYASVRPDGAPTVVTGLAYDGKDIWIATQSGLSRSLKGIQPSRGSASLVMEDKTVNPGDIFTVEVRLVEEDNISFTQLSGEFQYNTNQLEFMGGTIGNLMANWTVTERGSTPGRIVFKGIGGNTINNSGVIGYLSFRVNAALTEGTTVVYATNFTAGNDIYLNNEDLSIINYTQSGSANAGKGDANLDGEVDITDLIAVVNHNVYGGDYELTGDGLTNADVNEDGKVNNDDVSDILFYIFNGLFPAAAPTPPAPAGNVELGNLWMNQTRTQVTVPLRVTATQDVRNVEVVFEFDGEKIAYEAFSSELVESGNFVEASEVNPSITLNKGDEEIKQASFFFASPIAIDGEIELGNMVLSFPEGTVPEGSTVSTKYVLNGGEEVAGPTFEINSGITDVDDEVLPTEFSLSQNYPNPFNPSTVINYSLAKPAVVTLKIYNILGQEVKTLVNKEQFAGSYQVQWNGDDNFGARVASGVYLYRIETAEFVQAKKMVLIK